MIKIHAEIWGAEQKGEEVLAIEKRAALTAQVAVLKKKRDEIIAEMEDRARGDSESLLTYHSSFFENRLLPVSVSNAED